MKIDKLRIEQFKNLRAFFIDFNDQRLNAVLIGENGAGKSNLFEAITLIFRTLDLDEPVPFAYEIIYRLGRGEQQRTGAAPRVPPQRVAPRAGATWHRGA